jgi:hypothetical protein
LNATRLDASGAARPTGNSVLQRTLVAADHGDSGHAMALGGRIEGKLSLAEKVIAR